MNQKRCYIAIDLKSFYASVECVSRGLDPLTTNLVVADQSRSDRTICLAVTPSLKELGIPGRPRLFEVKQKINEINKKMWPPVEFIIAVPRMAEYIRVSNLVYRTYLDYISPDDIHVYSIDEVFMDVTGYLTLYNCTARELAVRMIRDVLSRTGITATAGIGTNMFLAKVAMDIVAKHLKADRDGVRIAELDEFSYREQLWNHRPITDFWRIGAGTARRLEKYELYTMGDIARCSDGKQTDFYNEEILYKEFGINAELLIDHAWGYEDCSIKDIKAYRPKNHSLSNGQVLPHAYTFENALLVIKEMAEELAMNLLSKHMVTNQLILYIGYDISNFKNNGTEFETGINSESAGGRGNFGIFTNSCRLLSSMAESIFFRITGDKSLLIRRINISAVNILGESEALRMENEKIEQPDLFGDFERAKMFHEIVRHEMEKDKSVQEAVLEMKKKFGKNAVFKGMDLQKEATSIMRNSQIGGHRA